MSDSQLQAIDASRFELRASSLWRRAPSLLDSLREQGLRRVSLAGLLGAARRRAEPLDRGGPPLSALELEPQLGFAWDEDDRRDERWYPQGVTTSHDASADGRWQGEEIALVSWYSKAGEGVRLTAAALEAGGSPRYEHLVLVQPAAGWPGGGPRLRRVRAHAGGIAWCGPFLYVADTIRGLRVFDLREVLELAGEDGAPLGAPARGLASSGWRWAVPQVGAYSLPIIKGLLAHGPRFSFVSAAHAAPGKASSRPGLVSGEYRRGRPGARLVIWPLTGDGSGRLATQGRGDSVSADRAWVTERTNLQGVLALGEHLLLASSAGHHRPGALTVHTGGEGQTHRHAWAVGPEDLTYLPGRDLVLTLTEHPHDPVDCERCGRVVFGVAGSQVLAKPTE